MVNVVQPLLVGSQPLTKRSDVYSPTVRAYVLTHTHTLIYLTTQERHLSEQNINWTIVSSYHHYQHKLITIFYINWFILKSCPHYQHHRFSLIPIDLAHTKSRNYIIWPNLRTFNTSLRSKILFIELSNNDRPAKSPSLTCKLLTVTLY